MSDATYKIRPLKWQKAFGEYYQRYWRIRADFDDRGDSFYETVKSASEGKKRCDEIYRQRLETMLVRVQEEDESE